MRNFARNMRRFLIITAFGMLLFASCSETKYVADGDLLLDKVKVKSDVKERSINTTELKSYVRQLVLAHQGALVHLFVIRPRHHTMAESYAALHR